MISVSSALECQRITLGGEQYVIVKAADFDRLCAAADRPTDQALSTWTNGGGSLARRLVVRRKRAGLSQAELARRAGIRVETLNRIERGRTTPDFATIRKLTIALKTPGT